jgi:hypothetical protein
MPELPLLPDFFVDFDECATRSDEKMIGRAELRKRCGGETENPRTYRVRGSLVSNLAY